MNQGATIKSYIESPIKVDMTNSRLVVRPKPLQKSGKAQLLPHAQLPNGADTFSSIYRDFNHHRSLRVRHGGLHP